MFISWTTWYLNKSRSKTIKVEMEYQLKILALQFAYHRFHNKHSSFTSWRSLTYYLHNLKAVSIIQGIFEGRYCSIKIT